jgi:hypothetical protein
MDWKSCALIGISILIIAVEGQALQPESELSDVRPEQSVGVLEKSMKNPRLQAVMKQHVHPQASIVSLEDLNALSQESFLNATDDGSPGFVAADFNGDGVADYGALLRFPQKAGLGEWLVVFIGSRNGGFQLRLLEKYNGFHDDVYITMEPGGTGSSDSTRRAIVRTVGIARIHPDRPATLFYWSKGRFQRLKISLMESASATLPSHP